MPWQFEPMKDVAACDKFWWGGKQPVTQKSPNGETYIVEDYMSLRRGGVEIGNRVKWNISVTRGKENKGYTYLNSNSARNGFYTKYSNFGPPLGGNSRKRVQKFGYFGDCAARRGRRKYVWSHSPSSGERTGKSLNCLCVPEFCCL